METKKYILSLDGGGIRGVIPLVLLDKLEKTTGKRSRDIFSFIAGTSTGAIIASSLAAGLPAADLLLSYKDLSESLFRKNILSGIKRFFCGYEYSTKVLRDQIAEKLGPAKKWVMNDSPVDLLISAKRVKDGMPWYFVRDNPANSRRAGNLPLVDCVTASAAAPTYFYPWTVRKVGALTDGGVGIAGNPVYQACVEAFYYTKSYDPLHTLVVSLGTGHFMKDATPTWFLSWVQWILAELLASSGEQQTEIVQRHFPKTPIYRLDLDLKKIDPTLSEDIPLDDSSGIDRLIGYGERFAKEVDWEEILAGQKNAFRITEHNTQWNQYCWPKS